MEQQRLFEPTVDDRGRALLRLRERTLAKRPAAPYVYESLDGTVVTEHYWDTDETTRRLLCVELMDLALSLPRRGGFRPEWKAYLQKSALVTASFTPVRTKADLIQRALTLTCPSRSQWPADGTPPPGVFSRTAVSQSD
jgi:hypothetical protein